MQDLSEAKSLIVLVTGPSGAGRSTAIRALEDMGYESIDNMPLSLLPHLLEGRPLDRPVALGLDIRNRDFSVEAFLQSARALSKGTGEEPVLLYLDARADVLLRRFSETRRKHPVSGNDAPSVGVERELEMLAPLRDRADILIDTSEMSPHELGRALGRWFGKPVDVQPSVSVQSFSYRRGLPGELDLVFDVRFLANPHWQRDLRPYDGMDPRVADYVTSDPNYAGFEARIEDLVLFLLPAYVKEGRSHVAIGFGCTGGRHRSVAVAERVANALAEADWRVSIQHRELERQGT